MDKCESTVTVEISVRDLDAFLLDMKANGLPSLYTSARTDKVLALLRRKYTEAVQPST